MLSLLLLAGNAAKAGPGLDLIVLVDRSTSMARAQRLAPLLLHMTLDLVARNAEMNRIDHRLAVITFGSAPRVDLPFAVVRRNDLQRLGRVIDALPVEDRGDTNVLAAFRAADELFRSLSNDPERRCAVVVLTDGVPYVRGADMNAYRAQLRRFVAARFGRSRVTVDVLLLGSAGRTPDRELWRALAQNVRIAEPAPDALLAEGHGVMTRLLGTRTVESAPSKTDKPVDLLIVPPYLDVIVFDVFRASSAATVDIYPPGSATPLRGGAGGVEAVGIGEVMATLVVPRPLPGQWVIRKSRPEARVRILSQQFFPRGVLVRPSSSDTLRQHDRVALAYRVIDSSGGPLAELPGYALAVDITLADPNGARTNVTMERAPALGPSGFRSRETTACTLAGRYWTDVKVTTVDAGGRRLDVFRDRWSGFSVAPASRANSSRAIENGLAALDFSLVRDHSSRWIVAALAALVTAVTLVLIRRATKP